MVTNSYRITGSLEMDALISNVARNAVANDRVVEAAEIDFKVDASGNVVLIGLEDQAQALWQTGKLTCLDQEQPIIVPRQEAFERIASATWKKVEQLKLIYEQMHRFANYWFWAGWSLVVVTCIAIIATLGFLVLLEVTRYHLSTLLLLIFIDILSTGLTALVLWRSHSVREQARNYLDHFLQVESFYKKIVTVKESGCTEATRRLLQEILIAKSLGAGGREIEIRHDRISHSQTG
jgi:hypothetical protein